MVRSMHPDNRRAIIFSPNGALLRKLWGTSKSHLENTPEPVVETVLDKTLKQPPALQDDSQMLVVQEDAQPRTLEDHGANTVGRVGHRLALEHWPTTSASCQITSARESARLELYDTKVWGDGWDDMKLQTSAWTKITGDEPRAPRRRAQCPCRSRRLPQSRKRQHCCGVAPKDVLTGRSRWSHKKQVINPALVWC